MSEYSDKVDDGTADGESARTEGHDSDYAIPRCLAVPRRWNTRVQIYDVFHERTRTHHHHRL